MKGLQAAVLMGLGAILSLGAAEPPPAAAATGANEFAEFAGEFDLSGEKNVSDPLIGYNRIMYRINDKIYFWGLRPLAKGYAKVAPEPVRLAIGRCFRNLGFPGRLVNSLLQGKFRRSGVECARFGVNTTVGLLGFFDPAGSCLKLRASREDCGQTLGRYGIGGGWPLVLPLMGPANMRDTLGRVGDFFLNPLSYVEPQGLSTSVNALERVNQISLHLGRYEKLTAGALDPYSLLRDAYKQNRDRDIQE
jgi:phospholipid-binding lipoprotein MlaA